MGYSAKGRSLMDICPLPGSMNRRSKAANVDFPGSAGANQSDMLT